MNSKATRRRIKEVTDTLAQLDALLAGKKAEELNEFQLARATLAVDAFGSRLSRQLALLTAGPPPA